MNLKPTATAIAVSLFPLDLGRDKHLERCARAKAGGPDATLACAECGRARWMHGTRHDTCSSFCYVTESTITDDMIRTLQASPDHPRSDERSICAAVFNSLRNYVYDYNGTQGRAQEVEAQLTCDACAPGHSPGSLQRPCHTHGCECWCNR